MKSKKPKTGHGTYKVGKGRPPRETQFKPGQSGNPKGRPRGSKSLKAHLFDALEQKVLILENGRQRYITAREFLARAIVSRAVKGDNKASALIIDIEPTLEKFAERAKPIDTANLSVFELTKLYQQTIRKTIV